MKGKKEHLKRVLTSLNLHLYHDVSGYRVTNRDGSEWLSSYLKMGEVYIWIDGYLSGRSKTT